MPVKTIEPKNPIRELKLNELDAIGGGQAGLPGVVKMPACLCGCGMSIKCPGAAASQGR
jgi:hypothetical protein